MRTKAAVFDCDGLLIDSTAAWAQAFSTSAEAFGYQLKPSEQHSLLGSSVVSGAAIISRLTGAPVQELQGIIADRLSAIVDDAPPPSLPGATTLIGELHRHMPLAVASNGPAEVVKLMLDHAGLLDAFETVCTAAEAGAAKPDPAVYLTACEHVGAEPELSYGFEDSAVGAEAVLAAGMTLVVIGTPTCELPPAAITAQRLDEERITKLIVGSGGMEERSW
ncbi:HAD family hydrolase [Streptomyces sp. NPDC004752]